MNGPPPIFLQRRQAVAPPQHPVRARPRNTAVLMPAEAKLAIKVGEAMAGHQNALSMVSNMGHEAPERLVRALGWARGQVVRLARLLRLS